MRFVSRLAAVALPPTLAILAMVACENSPTQPDKVVLGVTGCPAGYICTDKPHDGKAKGVPPTPPSGGVNNGGGSGSGGGGATPTQAPGATPTETPTVPCPGSFSVVGGGTPRLLSTAVVNDNFFLPDTSNYGDTCYVKETKVTLYVTTATGFVDLGSGNDYTSPSMFLFPLCGGGIDQTNGNSGFGGCASGGVLFSFSSAPASGNQIGTSCSDLVFNSASSAGDFDPATVSPPYAGTYHFTGLNSSNMTWRLRGLEIDLDAFGFPPDAILQCAKIDITTQVIP